VYNAVPIPVKVMVRPHAQYYAYTEEDIQLIQDSIDDLRDIGIDHIVFGALTSKNRLDHQLIERVCAYTSDMQVTIHKAIDLSTHVIEDIDRLRDIKNIHSILSSGGAITALLGLSTLQKMKEACGEEIELIPAGKITADNVDDLDQKLRCSTYHGRLIVA